MRFLFLISLLFYLVACKSEKVPVPVTPVEEQLKISIFPFFGNDNLYLDSSYTLSNNEKIKFTDIKFYLTEISNNSNLPLASVGLFNYRISNNSFITVKGNSSDFKTLKGYLGVHNDNHKDPSAFAANSPLNIMNCDGMHWGWNPGYSFVQIEAKADTLNDGISNFDHTIVFHVGTDQFLQTFSFDNLNWSLLTNKISTLKFRLDMKYFLENTNQPIDIKTEHMTHSAAGEELLCMKVIQNFKASLTPF